MASETSNPNASEESVLGVPPTLADEEWSQLLTSVFEAPPGYADGIVDSFEAPESADDEIDVDDHSIDFDAVAGGAGAAAETDDTVIDVDAADPESDTEDSEHESDASEHSAEDDVTDPDTGDSNSGQDFGFDFDTLSGTSEPVSEDPSFTIDTAELDADDLGAGLDGEDYGSGDYFA